MSKAADVIIVGLGAMGSASAYHLAKSGARVLGFDQFPALHTNGSSHGQTRIIREAYFEHPSYVPLVQRAYQLWDDLSHASDQELFLKTGGLMIGPPQGTLVQGALLSAERHRLPHEQLTAHDLIRRFPALNPRPDMVGLWEPRAGILFPEKCVKAHLDLATGHGAELRFEEGVREWHDDGNQIQVQTARGSYPTRRLLITAGSWIGSICPGLPMDFHIEQPAIFWFAPRDRALFGPDACPIHMWEHAPDRFFYGFPDLGRGVKLAQHHGRPIEHPDHVPREADPGDVMAVEALARTFLPGLTAPPVESAVCLYTNTRDRHFFLDRHPQHARVWVASPCSGHGFKFSCVIGEIMAQLILNNHCDLDISRFRRRPDPIPPSPHVA